MAALLAKQAAQPTNKTRGKNVKRAASRILWPSPQPTPSPPNYPPYVVAAAAAALAVISRYHVVMEVGGVESPWAAQSERAHHRRVSTGFVYCVLAEEERALAQREQTHSTRPLCVFEAKRALRRRHPSATLRRRWRQQGRPLGPAPPSARAAAAARHRRPAPGLLTPSLAPARAEMPMHWSIISILYSLPTRRVVSGGEAAPQAAA